MSIELVAISRDKERPTRAKYFTLLANIAFISLIVFLYIYIRSLYLLIGIASLVIVTDLVIVVLLRRRIRTLTTISKVLELIKVKDDTIVFNKQVELVKGYINIVSCWISLEGTKTYISEVFFEPLEKNKLYSSREINILNEPRGFLIIVDSDGAGVLRAPAYRFSSDPYKGVIMAILNTMALKPITQPIKLSIKTREDVVEASINIKKNVMRGKIHRYIIGKARIARLELYSSINLSSITDKCPKTIYIKKIMAIARRYREEFREVIAPPKPIILLFHEEDCSIRDIIKYLRITPPKTWGFFYGNHKIRLVLEIPSEHSMIVEKPFRPYTNASISQG